MSQSSSSSDDSEGDAEHRQYPFGLSSYQLFIFIVLVGLIGPGLVVYLLETANLSGVADLVWIVGYGTTIFVVWFIWIRPINLIGSSGHDASLSDTDDEDATEEDSEESTADSSSHSESSSAADAKQPATDEDQGHRTDPPADAE